MARTKQLPQSDTVIQKPAINLSDDSELDDDIAAAVEQPKATQLPKAKKSAVAAESARSLAAKQLTKASSGVLKNSKAKGKVKAERQDGDDQMDLDVNPKKWTEHVLSGSSSIDIASLRKENELLVEQNEQLRLALDEVIEAVKPSAREELLQAEIDSLNNLLKRQQTLLELRNSEYTKSRLINRDPAEPADWVTLDWADAQRDKAVIELTTQMDKISMRAEKAENARKEAERNGAEAQRELATVQRELDAEVVNSKKLQAEIGRRPAAPAPPSMSGLGGSSSQGKKAAPGSLELQRKLEFFEDLTNLSIISYVETVMQPGDVKKVTFTCLLSVENKEFPFKFVIWDERVAATEGDETEHVVYSPGEPLDPDLELSYLVDTFTFPRSQMRVFYQNMINILTGGGEQVQEEQEEDEEEEEEEEEE